MTVVDPSDPADSGWIAVDLDGTLAEYHGWTKWNEFGKPIPQMVDRIRQWLSEGREVRIFTARVAGPTHCKVTGEKVTVEMMIDAIHRYLVSISLPRLEVTCKKDFRMVELWDDRCVQVVPNTGRTLAEEHEAELMALRGKAWSPGQGMKTYTITIEVVPGDVKSEEHFSYECENDDQAWDYARERSRSRSAIARVKSVVRWDRNLNDVAIGG